MNNAKRIRWGILSTARIAASAMIPAIRQTKLGDVAAVASRDLQKAMEFAKKHQIPKAHGSYEALLADPDVDAIYNPLPVSMHAEWSIKASEAGKPVLCEKPLADNAQSAIRMVEKFRSHNLLLSEALMFRYHPLTRRVKALVEEGVIGRPLLMRAQFNSACPPGDIRLSKEAGGGGLLDLGCYCVSFMRMIAGEPARFAAVAHYNESGVDVNFAGAMSFTEQINGYFACSLLAPFDCDYSICGETGRIEVTRGALVAWPGESFKIRLWRGDEFEEVSVEAANPYALLVEDFQSAMLKDEAMQISNEDTLNNLRALDALAAVARSSQPGSKS